MKKEVIIGIFGLITLIGFVWGYKYLDGKNLFSNDSYFETSYENVADLGVSSIVQIKGFRVGNVTNIELDPNDVDKIKVSFSVDGNIKLPKNTIAAIKTNGVMGEKSIELQFDEICLSNCAVSGDILKSGTVGLLETMLPEDELDKYIGKLSDKVKGFVNDMKADTSHSTIKSTMSNIEETSLNLTLLTLKINKLLDQSANNINKTISNSAAISANLANNSDKITSILGGLETTLSKINGKLDETFDNSNASIKAVKNSLEEADKTFASLNQVLNGINNGDGTLNLLLHDKKMAKEVEFAVQNLGLLLQDLRLNPKRYINVSVFGKKQKKYDNPDSDPAFIK